jgi:hypothetical protein
MLFWTSKNLPINEQIPMQSTLMNAWLVSRTFVIKMLVSPYLNKLSLDEPYNLFWRGRCYYFKEIIERALHDFSAAILKGKHKDQKQFQAENMSEAYMYAGLCNH